MKMPDLLNKTCPYIQDVCRLDQCAWFDERLDNCAIHVMNFNMYKLARAMVTSPAGPRPVQPTLFPIPPRA